MWKYFKKNLKKFEEFEKILRKVWKKFFKSSKTFYEKFEKILRNVWKNFKKDSKQFSPIYPPPHFEFIFVFGF